jgi:hypothetical protein
MTAAPPLRDSVLHTLGYAAGVLRKPGFLWAPMVLIAIMVLPLAFLPGMDGRLPSFATQADVDAYVRAFLPVLATSALLGIVLGPLVTAVTFQLGRQYLDGESPRPFAAGIVDLALKYFLLTVTYILLAVGGVLVLAAAFVVLQAIAGIGAAILFCVIAAFVAYFAIAVRLAPASVLLLLGSGPVESIKASWELTRGQFGRAFRWLLVTALVIGIASGVTAAVVGAVLGALGFQALGQILGAAVAAPVNVMAAIALIRLALLLSNPNQPPPPPPPLPDWMNPPGREDPTGGPPGGGGPAGAG